MPLFAAHGQGKFNLIGIVPVRIFGNWVEVGEAAACRHSLFGTRGLIPLLIAGFAGLAAVSALRVGLLAAELSGLGGVATLQGTALTVMPITDLLFAAIFGWLCRAALRPNRRSVPRIATLACGLYALVLVSHVIVFRQWTHGEAFSFLTPAVYIHAVIPVLFCGWAIAYLRLSRRANVTYRGLVPVGDAPP